MTITKAALAAELQTDPAALGYGAAATPDDDVRIADLINAKTFSGPVTRMVTGRAISLAFIVAAGGSSIALSDAFLGKIKAAAASSPTFEMVWEFLKQEAGVDVASIVPIVTAMVGTLFTAEEAATLTALAIKPLSRAEVLWGAGTNVSPGDVSLTRG